MSRRIGSGAGLPRKRRGRAVPTQVNGQRPAEEGLRRRPPRATLRDVAAAAGVSPMTVSNVVNGRSGKVSEKTRSAIEREIGRLGYRPDTLARNLRRSERMTIGLMILDERPAFLADPLTTTLVAGLSNQLSERGYGLLIQGLHPRRFRNSMLIRDVRTDGICAVLSGSDAIRRHSVELLLSLGQPIVLFQDTLRITHPDLLVIRQDDRGGARLVASKVLERGARRLLMLVPDIVWPAMVERAYGVKDAIHRSRPRATLRVFRCRENDFDDIQAVMQRAIGEDGLPDALLAGNDQIGIAVLRYLQGLGVEAPRDILITGFNAFGFRRYTQPMLTTIRSPIYEMGVRGGQEILEKIGKGHFSRREIVFPVEFISGGTA